MNERSWIVSDNARSWHGGRVNCWRRAKYEWRPLKMGPQRWNINFKTALSPRGLNSVSTWRKTRDQRYVRCNDRNDATLFHRLYKGWLVICVKRVKIRAIFKAICRSRCKRALGYWQLFTARPDVWSRSSTWNKSLYIRGCYPLISFLCQLFLGNFESCLFFEIHLHGIISVWVTIVDFFVDLFYLE